MYQRAITQCLFFLFESGGWKSKPVTDILLLENSEESFSINILQKIEKKSKMLQVFQFDYNI